MAICKFFLQGNCRFGDNCRFEHPQNGAKSSGPGPRQNNQRHDPQPRNTQQRYTSPPRTNQRYVDANRNTSRSTNHREDVRSYKLMNQDAIEDDMTLERPQWICSAYGPVTGLMPTQLFGGPMEVSFEEARCEFYLAALSGNTQKAQADQENLWTQAQQQIIHVIENLPAAMKYLRDGANQRPNRADIVRDINKHQPNDSRRNARDFFSRENASRRKRQEENDIRRGRQQHNNAFGSGPTAPATSQAPWGQTQSNSFADTKPSNNVFGQQQQHQPQSNNAFLQPQPGVFGQPTMNGQLGQAPSTGNFGSTAMNGQLIAPSQPQIANGNVFGQPQPPQIDNNAFGQPLQPQPNNSVFGQAQPQMDGNVFGQPQQGQPNTAFEQPVTNGAFGSQPQTNFNQQQPLATSGNGFATAQSMPGVFGQPSSIQTNIDTPSVAAFSKNSGTTLVGTPSTAGFGQQTALVQALTPTPAPAFSSMSQATGSNITRNADGSLRTWKGQAVEYKNQDAYYKMPDGQLQRIWFPNGPQQADLDSYSRCVPPAEEYSESAKKAYETSLATGEWPNGKIPLTAPRPEWCGWEV